MRTRRAEEPAQDILVNSGLLTPEFCKIYDGLVFEQLDDHKYRVFFSVDHYDYIEDADEIAELDKLFA